MTLSRSSEPPASAAAPQAAREPASLLRWAFLSVAILSAAASAWMLGSYWLSAQRWLLGGAAMTLLLGIAYRRVGGTTPGARLAWRGQRWVLFLGAVFLALLWAQAANPSHRVEITPPTWKLFPIGTTEWAPKSLQAPFDGVSNDYLPYKNAWRYLLIFSIGWIYAAGLAVGLTKREDAQAWVRALAVNGFFVAVVCLLHRATGEDMTLWRFHDPYDFTQTPLFFYKNHNGAFLAALVAAALAAAAMESRPRLRTAWSLNALLVWSATVVVNSRVATAVATLWLLAYALQRAAAHWRRGSVMRNPRLLTAAAVALVLCIGVFATKGGRAAMGRFEHAYSAPADFFSGGYYRKLIRELGVTMWLDRPVFGWGGGSYLYLFETYHRQNPAIRQHLFREQPTLNRVIGPTANCDWIEFLVEYGAVGAGLLAAAYLTALAWWRRWRASWNPMGTWMMAAATGLGLHAFFDYILRSPPLLMLFLACPLVALRLCAPHKVAKGSVSRHRIPG